MRHFLCLYNPTGQWFWSVFLCDHWSKTSGDILYWTKIVWLSAGIFFFAPDWTSVFDHLFIGSHDLSERVSAQEGRKKRPSSPPFTRQNSLLIDDHAIGSNNHAGSTRKATKGRRKEKEDFVRDFFPVDFKHPIGKREREGEWFINVTSSRPDKQAGNFCF